MTPRPWPTSTWRSDDGAEKRWPRTSPTAAVHWERGVGDALEFCLGERVLVQPPLRNGTLLSPSYFALPSMARGWTGAAQPSVLFQFPLDCGICPGSPSSIAGSLGKRASASTATCVTDSQPDLPSRHRDCRSTSTFWHDVAGSLIHHLSAHSAGRVSWANSCGISLGEASGREFS